MGRDPLKQKAARERYVARHLALGLCRKCSEPATHGNFCRPHWEAYKIRSARGSQKIRDIRMANGLCIRCGMVLDPEIDSLTKCVSCLERTDRISRNPIRRYR